MAARTCRLDSVPEERCARAISLRVRGALARALAAASASRREGVGRPLAPDLACACSVVGTEDSVLLRRNNAGAFSGCCESGRVKPYRRPCTPLAFAPRIGGRAL